MTTTLVSLAGIHKRFGELEVLRGIDLDISPNDSVAIVGPSGSGKSTLLNIIGALEQPTDGRASFEGRDLLGMNDLERAALRNRSIGYVFQSHHLLPQCTALENVLVPTLVHPDRAHRRRAVERAQELLDGVGLGDRQEHRPAQLSGGECQRVAVVRALINEPQLLLADEPTGSLDRDGADRLGDLLCDLNVDHALAIVTVTHSERLAARMQRRYELRFGQLAEATIDA